MYTVQYYIQRISRHPPFSRHFRQKPHRHNGPLHVRSAYTPASKVRWCCHFSTRRRRVATTSVTSATAWRRRWPTSDSCCCQTSTTRKRARVTVCSDWRPAPDTPRPHCATRRANTASCSSRTKTRYASYRWCPATRSQTIAYSIILFFLYYYYYNFFFFFSSVDFHRVKHNQNVMFLNAALCAFNRSKWLKYIVIICNIR